MNYELLETGAFYKLNGVIRKTEVVDGLGLSKDSIITITNIESEKGSRKRLRYYYEVVIGEQIHNSTFYSESYMHGCLEKTQLDLPELEINKEYIYHGRADIFKPFDKLLITGSFDYVNRRKNVKAYSYELNGESSQITATKFFLSNSYIHSKLHKNIL